MILDALKRKHVEDDKLWTMVDRANKLTTGSYTNWDDNAAVLVPLMDRILIRAREMEDWQVYFYAMARHFWFVRRTAVNDIRRAFRISEMFHRDCARHVGENASVFAKEWRVNIAARVLGFYLDYPQVDDAKMEQMLGIFLDYEKRYGSSWNLGDYNTVMWMALVNRDKKLAETARKKLSKADYKLWCYVCYYGKAMIGYYVLHEDVEGVEEMIGNLCERNIPVKYQWCFANCESTKEKDLVNGALMDCLKFGTPAMFVQIFNRWKSFYQESEQGEVDDTHAVLFHTLAGDWSRCEERLQLAEKDDRLMREKREAPLDSLYWALCWYCYFRMLERSGVKTVGIRLGDNGTVKEKAEAVQKEDAEADGGTLQKEIAKTDAEIDQRESAETEPGADPKKEPLPEWLCSDAADYFERQADEIGEQMDKARKQFHYARVKQTYEACFLPFLSFVS